MSDLKWTKSEWIRRIILHHIALPWAERMRIVHGPPPNCGWGSTRITYAIMTDSEGVKWKVPTTIDGKPVEYLEKHEPPKETHEYDRIVIRETPENV